MNENKIPEIDKKFKTISRIWDYSEGHFLKIVTKESCERFKGKLMSDRLHAVFSKRQNHLHLHLHGLMDIQGEIALKLFGVV